MSYPFHYDMPRIAPQDASELAIQASCKMRAETQFDCLFAAIPNGTRTTKFGGWKAKKEGVRKGMVDAIIIGSAKNAGKVAFCEFKAGSSLSVEQNALLAALTAAGHDAGVFRSQDTLAQWLEERGWK
jgi:hypothetical protein